MENNSIMLSVTFFQFFEACNKILVGDSVIFFRFLKCLICCLIAHWLQICSAPISCLLCEPVNCFSCYFGLFLCKMKKQNSFTVLEAGKRYLNLQIKATCSDQSRIDHLKSIRRSNHKHVPSRRKPIHFSQYLVESWVSFRIWGIKLVFSPSKCVNFINENDCWRVFSGLLEKLSHSLCSNPNIHFTKLRCRTTKEMRVRFTCSGFR